MTEDERKERLAWSNRVASIYLSLLVERGIELAPPSQRAPVASDIPRARHLGAATPVVPGPTVGFLGELEVLFSGRSGKSEDEMKIDILRRRVGAAHRPYVQAWDDACRIEHENAIQRFGWFDERGITEAEWIALGRPELEPGPVPESVRVASQKRSASLEDYRNQRTRLGWLGWGCLLVGILLSFATTDQSSAGPASAESIFGLLFGFGGAGAIWLYRALLRVEDTSQPADPVRQGPPSHDQIAQEYRERTAGYRETHHVDQSGLDEGKEIGS